LLRFFAVRNRQSEIRNYQMSRQYTLQRPPRPTSVRPNLNPIDSILDTIGISFLSHQIDEDSNLNENGCMKTTVNIPDRVLRDAMRHTKAKTKREAIVKALEEMNCRHSQAELLKYTGKFKSLMTNEEIEALDENDWKSWTKTSKTYSFSRKKK
jgi:Arc/MetJ family transcription regulator